MLRPSQSPLTDAAAGRMSMPFLPTLAVVIALSAGSLLCPSSRPAAPGPRAELAAASPAPGLTDFAPLAPPAHAVRMPATLAFAASYPLGSYPLASAPALVAEASASPAQRPSAGPRVARLAVAGRPPCPGRRCVEPAAAIPSRGPDPLAAARAKAEDLSGDGLFPPLALPFTALAETLAPAARLVGEAAGLVRRGAASVQSSAAMLAECLQ